MFNKASRKMRQVVVSSAVSLVIVLAAGISACTDNNANNAPSASSFAPESVIISGKGIDNVIEQSLGADAKWEDKTASQEPQIDASQDDGMKDDGSQSSDVPTTAAPQSNAGQSDGNDSSDAPQQNPWSDVTATPEAPSAPQVEETSPASPVAPPSSPGKGGGSYVPPATSPAPADPSNQSNNPPLTGRG